MKPLPSIVLALLFAGSVAFARIGDTPAQLKERFGEPVGIAFDQKEYGIGLYRAPGFKETRVTFVAGRSQVENYFLADEEASHERIVAVLEEENPEHEVIDGHSLGIEVGEREPEGELKFVTHSGQEKSFTGILELKQSENRRWAFIRAGDVVVEIEFTGSEAEFANLQTGMKCTVTVLDENADDLYAPIAVVGGREHLDWNDSVRDAHDSFQRLVKIVGDSGVLFDRAVCGVHHRQMELRKVPIAYGMLAFSAAERFCQAHFPHARDYAVGGCVMDSADEGKLTAIYLCPACVAACNDHKAMHPAEEKP